MDMASPVPEQHSRPDDHNGSEIHRYKPVAESSESALRPFVAGLSLKPLHEYEPLVNPDKCIRLLIIHQGQDHEPVHLEFLNGQHTLGDPSAPSYDALSYVWGSEQNPVPVDIGPSRESHAFITQNLAEALVHLRFPSQWRIMWVDALCIDQGNNKEKSQQAAVMGEIFKQAACTIAWLGAEADESGRALDFISAIGSGIELPQLGAYQRFLDALFRQEWFERLWVRQEVALAQLVLVRVGWDSISWTAFRAGIKRIRRMVFADRSSFGRITRARIEIVYNVCRPALDYGVSNLHDYVCTAECKDPRDKIFAVLHLFHKGQPVRQMTPDYSKSAAEVYRDVVLLTILGGDSLNFLRTCQKPRSGSVVHDLPSWVPDWASFPPFLLKEPSLGAARFTPITQYKGDNVLRVSGVLYGHVARCVKLPLTTGSPVEHVRHAYAAISSQINLDARSQRNQSTGQDSEYAANVPILDEFCVALYSNRFRGSFRPPIPGLPNFVDIKKLYRQILIQSADGSAAIDSVASLDHHEPFLARSCLFTTEEGLIGSGTADICAGDIVALFLGCIQSTVLRPKLSNNGNTTYYIVGSCCVPAVAAGEPLLGALPRRMRHIWDSKRGLSSFVNAYTGKMTRVDPRLLPRLGIDEAAMRACGEEPPRRHAVSKEEWKAAGVDIQDFDLV